MRDDFLQRIYKLKVAIVALVSLGLGIASIEMLAGLAQVLDLEIAVLVPSVTRVDFE